MINWKLRFKNKTTLAALIGAVVSFAYQVCGIAGVVPPVSQDQTVQVIGILLNVLAALGVVTDPTTAGVGDSEQALGYDEPKGVGEDA